MSSALRKAAILISSLDRRSADALLDQMPDAQAARVRQAVLDLDDIDPAEQKAIINEFVRGKGASSGVELDAALMSKFSATSQTTPVAFPEPSPIEPAPFGFLQAASGETLGRFLEREHPQTVALVLAHLPPRRSAETLSRLPPALQTEVLRRIADLEEASPEVLHELEQSLENLLANELHAGRRRSAGLAAVGAILDAASGTSRQGMLASLTAADAELAARLKAASGAGIAELESAKPARSSRFPFFWSRSTSTPRPAAIPQNLVAEDENDTDYFDDGPEEEDTVVEESASASTPLPPVEFEDFLRFDNRSLALILRAADPRIAQLALTGAPPELLERLFRQLPPREAKEMQKRLDLAGPLRLRDVEVAQRQMALIASRLAAKGQISLPKSKRFAAAA